YQFVSGLAQRKALISEKEERLIPAVVELRNADRAAYARSEFVAHQVRRRKVRRVLARFGDTEIVVSRSLEERTVERVAAGLRGQDNGGRRGELSAGIEGLEPCFLNRVG